jgi:hypothetical protein
LANILSKVHSTSFLYFLFEETQTMLTIPLKKLSQATAAAALGVAMIAAVGTAPASAVQFKTFNLSGTFASQADPGSSGLVANLAGGSFDGTYEVDVDQLPYNNSNVLFTAWNINFLNSANTLVTTFSNLLPNSFASLFPDPLLLADSLRFGNDTESLTLFFNNGFTGTGTALQFGDNGQPPFAGFAVNDSGTIAVISATSSAASGGGVPVPEPITMSGMVLGSAIGLLMKRKQKVSQSS